MQADIIGHIDNKGYLACIACGVREGNHSIRTLCRGDTYTGEPCDGCHLTVDRSHMSDVLWHLYDIPQGHARLRISADGRRLWWDADARWSEAELRRQTPHHAALAHRVRRVRGYAQTTPISILWAGMCAEVRL